MKRLIYYAMLLTGALLMFPSLSISQQLDTWTFIGDGAVVAPTDTIYSVKAISADTILIGSTNSRIFITQDGGATWGLSNLGAGSHDIVSLLYHPTSKNILYAATDSGGVFKSVNFGTVWSATNSGLTDILMTDIQLNTLFPDTIFAVSDSGIFISNDSGASWAPGNSGLSADSSLVYAIGNTRINPDKWYAGTTNGKIFQSVNYGISWTRRNATALDSSITSIVVDDVDPNIIYVGTAGQGIWKSTNAGATLTQIPVDNVTDDINVRSMVLDNSTSKKVFAGTNGPIPTVKGVFRLNASDTTFAAVNSGLTSGIITNLDVDPNNPHVIYAGTIGEGAFKYVSNRAPSLDALPDVQTTVGATVSFTVTATDPDTNETANLVFNASGIPSGASFDSLATRIFSWTPTVTDIGDNIVTFTVIDQRGGIDSTSVTINVNRAPVLTVSDTTVAGQEDSLITITVLATDADSDPLVYTTSSLPTGANFDTSGVKTFTWTPTHDQSGVYTITFTADDGRSGVANFDVVITVANNNRVPAFNPALTDRTVAEGNALSFTLYGVDPDGDPVFYGIQDTLPPGAGFDSLDTRRFSWIPTFDDSGSYVVVFTLMDDIGGALDDSVSITVTNTNRAPVISNLADTVYVNEGDSLAFTLDAADLDGDTLSFQSANLPLGSYFNLTTGYFKWIPSFSQEGTHRIVFSAIDDKSASSYEDLIVVVNQQPYWGPVVGQSTQEGVALAFTLNATDEDGDSLTYTYLNVPDNTVITSTDSVRFSWTPQNNQEGMYAVTFIVEDGVGGRDETIVPIQVSSSTGQLPPTIINLEDIVTNENERIIFQVVATDDGPQDSLTFGLVGSLPAGSQYDTTGTHIFDWTPGSSQSGIYRIIFTVADKFSNVTQDTLDITVVNVNRAPITNLPSDTTFSEGDVINLPLNIVDPDGDSLTVLFTAIPQGAVIDSASGLSLIWTPSHLQEGEYTFGFIATDVLGMALSKTLSIVITNGNRVPPAFNIIYPAKEDEANLDGGIFIWERSNDPDIDDILSYVFEIDDDSTFSSIDISLDTVNSSVVSASASVDFASLISDHLQPGLSKNTASASGEAFVLSVADIPGINALSDDGLYYWRVKAYDNRSGESSYTTGINSFYLNTENDPPSAPAMNITPVSPTVTVAQPLLNWNPAHDPDHSDHPGKIKYAVEFSEDNFASVPQQRFYTNFGQDSLLSPFTLLDNDIMYYRLKAFDDNGDSSAYSVPLEIYVNLVNEGPDDFGLLFPENNHGFTSRPDSIFFDWEDSYDSDPGNFFHYKFEISTQSSFEPENIVFHVDSISNSVSAIKISADILTKADYYWRVLAVDEFGFTVASIQSRMFGLITSILEPINSGIIPNKFIVNKNYPNPFNNTTSIKFGIPRTANTVFSVYSVTGSLVYRKSVNNISPGYHLFRWDGKSNTGKTVSTGIYLVTISIGKEFNSQKISLIK